MIFLALFLLLLVVFLAFFIGAGRKFSPNLLALGMILPIPLAALALYGFFGNPATPSAVKSTQTLPENIQNTFGRLETEAAETSDPQLKSQNFRFLAEIEWRTNAKDLALKDWHQSLEANFTPEVATELAEAESENAGYVTKEAQDLYAKALETKRTDSDKATPPAWQKIARMRLMQAQQEREKEGDEAFLISPELNK